jgi:hypothetical protein
MKISSYFLPIKYFRKIEYFVSYFKRVRATQKLIANCHSPISLKPIWVNSFNEVSLDEYNDISKYKVFSTNIDMQTINWHKDYVSGYEYPLKMHYHINISKQFDKGIDVKFPWEVSRFYFGVQFAKNYRITKNDKYYTDYKSLILSWIEYNPYCIGVNWVCTMEVSIRAINWIVSLNMFGEKFHKDLVFIKKLSISLQQHAEYISSFPEIYKLNGITHSGNHTTAGNAGLLFLSITLKNSEHSNSWIGIAIEGLESNIAYQTYNDGVNFEASIPYHRLVLELFSYCAIVLKYNEKEFSSNYYRNLFKMFEYTSSYMDKNGNAPQIGDNDSGRVLRLSNEDESDHSYLLSLGEYIFKYTFKSQSLKRSANILSWLPTCPKVIPKDIDVVPRLTDETISYENGGVYFIKNYNYSILLSCVPIGQNGVGGHNHHDYGSLIMSYRGTQIVSDPGSYTYTRNIEDRNKYRAAESHNVIISQREKKIRNSINDVFRLSKYVFKSSIVMDDNRIMLRYKQANNAEKVRIITVNKNSIQIKDQCAGKFHILLHLHPDITNIAIEKNTIYAAPMTVVAHTHDGIRIKEYNYSIGYDHAVKAKQIEIWGEETIEYSFSRK